MSQNSSDNISTVSKRIMLPLPVSKIPPPLPPLFFLPQEQSKHSSSSRENIPFVDQEQLYNQIYNDILKKCDILNIVCKRNKTWMYPVYPYLQIGPTCGLAIICMWANSIGRSLNLADLLSISKANGFTKQGEMFSVANLKALCIQVLGKNRVHVYHGTQGLEQDKVFISKEIKAGAIAFVPYDADYNHGPCLKNGLKAHWALVFGLLEPDNEKDEDFYVLARQGKSSYVSVWSFSMLSASNGNLRKINPERCNGDYVIPRGGIEQGLCNQYLLLKPSKRFKLPNH